MRRHDDEGYATPAATVISAAISMVVAAVVVRSLADLHLAQAELARTKVEYELSAAHNAALLVIATSSKAPPFHWTLASLGNAYDVIAEPERMKMSPQAFATLGDATYAAFAVDDAAPLRARLSNFALGRSLTWMADEDRSRLWINCASTYVSPYGRATALMPPTYSEPVADKVSGSWRPGEVWRIQVTDQGGWRDERVVRFTGDGLNPVVPLGRRLSRGWKGAQTCQDLIKSDLAA